MSAVDFYFFVHPRGPWDYKHWDGRWADFGDFNYGLTGRIVGFHETMLLRMAGWAEETWGPEGGGDGGSSGVGTLRTPCGPLPIYWPFAGTPPYGDTIAAQNNIRAGIRYYRENVGWQWRARRPTGLGPQEDALLGTSTGP